MAAHGFHSCCFKAACQWHLPKLTTSSSQVGAVLVAENSSYLLLLQ
jgi:hypothetical protein